MLYKKAAKKFLDTNVDRLLRSKPSQAHRTLRLMGARPGEDLDNTATDLPEFKDSGLTNDDIANQIGDFFLQNLTGAWTPGYE